MKKLTVCLLLFFLVMAIPGVSGVYNDGSFSGGSPPESDGPGSDSGSDGDGSDDPSGGSGGSGSGGTSGGTGPGSDEDAGPTDDEIADAVDEQTQRILDQLREAARRVASADTALRRLLAGDVYTQRTDPARTLGSSMNAYMDAGRTGYNRIAATDSHAWDQQRAGASRVRSDLQRELGISRSPHRGDPVRVVDGAYLTTIPLPVIRLYDIEIDLSLHYDSRRTARGLWGTGWTGVLEERIITGALRPPAIEALHEEELAATRNRIARVEELIGAVLSGDRSVPDAHTAVAGILRQYRRDLDSCNSRIDRLSSLLPIAATYGASVSRVQLALDTARSLRSGIREGIAILSSTNEFLNDWRSTRDGLNRIADDIETLQRTLAEARERYDHVVARNRRVDYPGTRIPMTDAGYATAVYVDQHGSTHLFSASPDPDLYRAASLPHYVLRRSENGWRLRAPSGHVRGFNRSGELAVIGVRETPVVHIHRTVAHETRTVTVVRPDGHEYARLETVDTDGTMTLHVASGTQTAFTVASEGITDVDSPRGDLSYRYGDAGMTAIVREDGRRTEISYESGPAANRVTSVTYPSGAREFFEYPAPDLRIYRDPDGLETRTTVDGFSVLREERPSGHVIQNEYDEFHRLVRQTDNRGHSERRRYDKRGALVERQFADGSWMRITRDGSGASVAVTSDRGTVWEATRGPDGAPHAVTHEDVIWRITRPPGEADTRRVTTDRGGLWEIVHTRHGTPHEIVRGDGRRETFTYDALGRRTERSVNGEVAEHISYNGAGRPVRVVRDGTTYEYRYESDPATTVRFVNGRFLSRSIHDADGHPIRHQYHDDTTEEFVRSAAGRIVEYTARSGTTFRYNRDARGRLVSIVVPEMEKRWTFQYDATGRRVGQTLPDGSQYRYRFDANGQRIGTQLPDGSATIEEHLPGGRVRRVNPFGDATIYRHDATGRPKQVIEGDGSDLRIDYIDEETRYTANGELLVTVTRDAYGRITERAFSDGTAERYRYGNGPLPTERIDRRGGREEWRWDRFGRCIYHRRSDGAEERWQYRENSTVHRGPDGDETLVRFDPEGRPVTITTNGEERAFSYGSDGTLEITAPDGSTERRYFEPLSRVFGMDPLVPFTHYTDTPIQRDRNGTVRSVWNGTERTVSPHWTGLTAQLREAVGTPAEAIWRNTLDPYGQVTARTTPDSTEFELQWDAEGRILRRRAPDGVGRTYRYDRFGNLAGWRDPASDVAVTIDPLRRDVTARDDGTGAYVHAVTFGPYGRLLRDEQSVPVQPDSGIPETVDAGTQAPSEESTPRTDRLLTRIDRDAAGRAVRIESNTVSETLDISYSGDGTEVTIAAGGYTITTTPEDTASSDGKEALSVTVGTPDGTTRQSSHTLTETVHDGHVIIDQSLTDAMTFSHRRRSGFKELLDAVIYVRDRAGRVIAEQDLNGTLHSFRYDGAGRMEAIAYNGSASSGSAVSDVSRVPATTTPAAALSAQWRNIPGLRGTPESPLRMTEFRLRRSPAGRIVSTADTTADASGRRTAIGDTAITYHPISERPRTVRNGDSIWTIDRRIDGAPVRYVDHVRAATYGCTEHRFAASGYTVTVRYWERNVTSPETAQPDRTPTGRYLPAQPAADTQSPVDTGGDYALEIRIDDRPFLYVDGNEIVIPFSDIRGSVRGVYRPGAVSPQPRFAAFPPMLLYLATGSRPEQEIPSQGRRGLPAAVPYNTVISTLDHLPGIDLLFAPERAVSPETGTFTAMDPSLDGMDWYQFAAGDPINFQDTTGRYVVSVKHGHEQQDERWSEDYLGSSADTTIHDAGCTLVTVSNAINQITDDVVTDPGRLNRALTDSYYVDDNLLANRDVETILTQATGHEVAHVSIRPEEVDIDRVIDAIANDPNTSYVVSARIQTYTDTKENGRQYYPHSLSISGFDDDNVPVFRDTSNRRRTGPDPDETVLRYDVYATSKCPVH